MAIEIISRKRIHPVQGVLFDMDGLVLDTEKLYCRFGMEAARQMDLTVTKEEILGLRSLSIELGQQYFAGCVGPDADYNAFRNLRTELMNNWLAEHGVEIKPGVYELLEYLHAHHIPCAVTTSSSLDRAEAYLKPLHLYEQFNTVCSGHNLAHGKPAPDIYLLGAEKLQLKPEDCLALEDSPAGVESAFRAGCMAVVIPDLDQPSAETLSRCFARADSLTDIIELLQQVNL